MRFSSAFVALAAPYLVSAAPARFYGLNAKRAEADITVFKFADVLEQLESQFYNAALGKFKEQDFTGAGFGDANLPVEQMKVMAFDEQTHSTALQAALKSFGQEPITSCKFKFDDATKDLKTTLATARVVENVGVSAYLGGATLLTDPVLLDAAGSILSIEARHSTILNVLSAGAAIPSAFDVPLSPPEILAIASPFIDTSSPCDLGIKANPTLSITNTEAPKAGTKLEFKSDAINGSTEGMFCNMMVGGAPLSISLPMNDCKVPDGINGPVVLWVTSDDQPLVNNVRDRATDKLVAGPTVAFVDTVSEVLGKTANPGAGGGSGGSGGSGETTSTSTISPEAAASVVASASGGAAGAQATGGASSGGINLATGKSGDGAITIKGWTNLPDGAK